MRELLAQAQAAFKDARFPPCNQFSLGDVDEIAEKYTTEGSAAATALMAAKAKEAFYDEAQRRLVRRGAAVVCRAQRNVRVHQVYVELELEDERAIVVAPLARWDDPVPPI